MTELLATVDQDGAVRDAAARVTRGELVAGAVLGGGLLGALGRPARALAQSRRDVSVLNYALSLEYLQDAFYTEAQRVGALGGRAAAAAEVLGGVERAHVRAFRDLLGRDAIRRPSFDFRGTTEEERAFLRTAVALEDLSVEAYKGQVTRIRSDRVLAAAVGIHSVEARHAAWMRFLFGIQPAVSAFDDARGRDAVLRTVASTRFVTDRPRTTRWRRRPRFTG